jgi:hypothetical protein
MSVHYLPSRSLVAPPPIEGDWPSFPVRFRNAWWRVRLALVEVRALLRSRPDDAEEEWETPVPTTPAPARPARVLDFEAARRRLRPAAGG